MWASRARSPLRWLWAGTSALGILAVAGITGQVWLVAIVPLVAAVLLFAPPVGVFRHDETPAPRTGAWLTQREVAAHSSDPPSARRLWRKGGEKASAGSGTGGSSRPSCVAGGFASFWHSQGSQPIAKKR